MQKIKEWSKKHWFYGLGIFIVSFLLFIPMFINPYHENNDTFFHIANISATKTMIENDFFSGLFDKIVPRIANNFGYGTKLFYPPLAHTLASYLAVFLKNFHLDILATLKIFHFLVFAISGIVMYGCSYRFHKNKLLSFISALIYLTSAYHISEIYVRDALAESLIFIFLPLIITSVKELLEGNKKIFYPLFIIGYVGGILSHFTMMIYFTLFLGIAMLFFYKKIFKKEFLIPFIKGCLLVFAFTAFFFEPLFEHKLFGNYRVYQKWVMSMGIQHTALHGYEYFLPYDRDGIIFCFSLVTITLLVALYRFQKKSLKEEKYKLVLIFGLISLWCSTAFFPWILMPYTLFMIQFGWRLVTFVILGVSLLAPLALKKCRFKSIYVLTIVGLIVSGFTYIHYANEKVVLSDDVDASFGMGWQREYLPVNTEINLEYFNTRGSDVVVTDGDGVTTVLEDKIPNLKFMVETDEKVTIELPRIFYFGYQLVDEENNIFELTENENGFLSTVVDEGVYTLTYEGTTAYKICFAISYGTLGILIIYLGTTFILKKNAIK